MIFNYINIFFGEMIEILLDNLSKVIMWIFYYKCYFKYDIYLM